MERMAAYTVSGVWACRSSWYVGACSSKGRQAASTSRAVSMLWRERSVLRMWAKVHKWPHYRHSNALKTWISGNEMNDAFNWMRSWVTALCGCVATIIKPTKNGMTSSRKGEMLLVNFFIFHCVSGLANHINSSCTLQRNRLPTWYGKVLDQRWDFLDQRDLGVCLSECGIGRWK